MAQRQARRLQRGRETEPDRRRNRLGRRVDQGVGDEPDAVRGQQSLPVVVLRRGRGRFEVHSGQRQHRAGRVPPPLGVVRDPAQRPRRLLDRRVRGYPRRHPIHKGGHHHRLVAGQRDARDGRGEVRVVGEELAGQRRGEHHGERVDALVDGGLGEPVAELVRAGHRSDVARVPVRDHQAVGDAGGRGQRGQRGRVADDADPAAAGQRLGGQQRADVEELADRVDPDHAGAGEQRPHRRRVEAAFGAARRAYRRRDRDDRLVPPDAAGEPGELARVTERLQVQQDHVGAGVVPPVLEQVVAGHVGAVAGRDERRQAQAAPVRLGEQRDPERAGLAEEADPARAPAAAAPASR